MPGQSEGCYEKLSKCNILHKIVHLGHAFDLVNKFDKFYFQKKCPQYFFLQKTYWATIMSRDNKTHILQCSVTKMHFSPVVHTFLYSPNTFLSEFTKISSIPDHMWQGHLIVPGQQNNVPGRMKFLFWAKSALIRSRYSQNFVQDPAGPIWTALYRYIYPEIYFTTRETHFCQMSRDNKNE